MAFPQMHMGSDAPSLVTHEGLTYVVRDWRGTMTSDGTAWRVLAECPELGARKLADWMVATFTDAGDPVGAWVCCNGLGAWEMWNRRD